MSEVPLYGFHRETVNGCERGVECASYGSEAGQDTGHEVNPGTGHEYAESSTTHQSISMSMLLSRENCFDTCTGVPRS